MSIIKSKKFTIFSSALMLTTLASPLLITSITPVQQKQIAPEIKIKNSEFSNTERLKNGVIKYVFENNQGNMNSIKSELDKLLKLNKLKDFSQKDLDKATENLISFTKDHFKDKETLEEAWYHWFPMAFWYSAYGVVSVFDGALNLLGSLFNELPNILETGKIAANAAVGNYSIAATQSFVLMTKLLTSMYTNEKNILRDSLNDATLDTVSNFLESSDPRSITIKFLTDIAKNLLFNTLNDLVQKIIGLISRSFSFAKVKIWANYVYYYNLYWGN